MATKYDGIELFVDRTQWMARFIGDHAGEVIEAFGTPTIPTSFTSRAPAAKVLEAIQKLNPGCDVYIVDYLNGEDD